MVREAKVYKWETVITEGLAKIIAPNPEYYRRPDGVYEPAWAPVFYNPVMKHNRDIAVVIANTLFSGKEWFYVEPLAGTGVRGIRYSLEATGCGVVNDVDPIAYNYIRRNIYFNNLTSRIEAYHMDANILLHTLRHNGLVIDYIDIDPYGSPIPFIDSSLEAIARRGYVATTATDTGTLCCSYREACYRRYGAVCYKTLFLKEMGLRILIGAIVRHAAVHGIALKPLLTYYRDYYYRVYFSVEHSCRQAYMILRDNIGYIIYDTISHNNRYERECTSLDRNEVCIGPLWIGSLGDRGFVEDVIKTIGRLRDRLPHLEYLKPFLHQLSIEYTINKPYYRYDILCGLIRRNMPPRRKLVEELNRQGFIAIETHFDPRGVKTDADYNSFMEILESI